MVILLNTTATIILIKKIIFIHLSFKTSSEGMSGYDGL